LALAGLEALAQPVDPARTTLIIEALRRLPPEQIKANPKLQAALNQVLESSRGTAQFVELVRQLQIKDQDPALLEFAIKNSTNASGVDAARLILENRDLELLRNCLTGTDTEAAIKLAEALGNVRGNQIVPLLVPLVTDPKRDVALRKQAVRALAKTPDGAAALLRLAREETLPNDLRFVAGTELQNVRWPKIKAQAAEIFPPPQIKNAEALPPIAELLKRKGDENHGAEVFARDDAGCIKCHQVNGKGIDFGPNLSEIGNKLGKDALYESILDPSAGIAFGYEAYQIELRNGDEAFGLVVSETADELAIKAQTGIVTKYKKNQILKKEQQKVSVMPAGLQQAMSIQELVDLVEYLSSLKKASQ
jgi:putative heme-binding domain-containing protein